MVAWDPCRSITDQFLATFEAARRRVLSSCFENGIGVIWPKQKACCMNICCPKCRMSSTDGRIVCIVQSLVFGITGTRSIRTISNFERLRWTCMDCKHGWMRTILQFSSRSEVFFSCRRKTLNSLKLEILSRSRTWQTQWAALVSLVPEVSSTCESAHGTWHVLESNGTWSCFVGPVWSCFLFFGGGFWGIRWANVPHYSGGFLYCCSDHLVRISQSSAVVLL